MADQSERDAWERLNALWAKLPRHGETAGYHPLLAHMIDVGQVARAMWRLVLPPAAREAVAEELGVEPEVAGGWVALWAGAHDLGKASPAFARQNSSAWERIRQAGFPCPADAPTIKAPHGTITALELPELLSGQSGVPKALGRQIGRLVGGHHGVFPRTEDIQKVRQSSDAIGGRSWALARERLLALLAELLGVEGRLPETAELASPTIMYLAGLVSVADWIGSNTEYFRFAIRDPDVSASVDWRAYPATAEQAAQKALRELGWLAWSPAEGRPSFTELFPFIETPNTLQRTIVEIAEQLDGPSLVVVEAPMGEGKTEASLFLTDRWAEQHGQRGLYVALPTQATSNQMFGRVRRFLEHRYPGRILNLQLLHGHAALSAELEALRRPGTSQFEPSDIHDEDTGQQDAAVYAAEWFTYRKRGLLAPFGVGTVDQTLLAVLKTRHQFVRLFGLGHKTIVVDEVHAYDTYMSTLLEGLLRWLASLGASVVLLSATLPRARLNALLDAYAAGRTLADGVPTSTQPVPYPRISWVDRRGVHNEPVQSSGRATTVHLKRLTCDLPPLAVPLRKDPLSFGLGEKLAKALEPGGCAAVICTTVGRAQRMYAALTRSFEKLPLEKRPNLELFHARYRFRERDEREKEALRRFGKAEESVVMPDGAVRPVDRPDRAVIVATQVIEQSLDIDFDLMVSELAPIDLVLQRLGRLHRHDREDRPAHLATPTLWLIEPANEDGAPVFERDQRAVYDPHVLLRSWLALQGQTVIRIPEHVEHLIDEVYDDRMCPPDAPTSIQTRWSETVLDLARVRQEQQEKAEDALFVAPSYEDDIFELFNPQLAEDDPTVHQTFQALTRLGDPSLPAILLRPEEVPLADLGRDRPSVDQVRPLLERSVTLTHRGLVPYLLSDAGAQEALPPASWRRSALLRHHRLLRLDGDGRIKVGPYVIQLDRDLGVLVEAPSQSR